jgi:hypothetical protein
MRFAGGERPVVGVSAVCDRCAVLALGPLLLGLPAEWDPCPLPQCRGSRVQPGSFSRVGPLLLGVCAELDPPFFVQHGLEA